MSDTRKLGARFQAFLRSHPGAELIDDLPATDPASLSSGEERADFLLEKRRFLGEIKSLETDTRYKMDAILAPHLQRPDWPEFFGSWPLERVLQTLPDGQEILRQVSKAVTSAIPGIVRKANSQIASTKRAIDAPSGEGILVVLNDGIELLLPQTVISHIRLALKQRKGDGTPSFRHIQLVLVASEAHHIVPGGDPRGLPPFLPLFSAESELAPPTEGCRRVMNQLLVGWARFNGGPLVISKGSLPTIMPASEAVAARGPMKRSDAWRLNYRAKRTLATLSFEELMAYGRSEMEALTPHFLKNSTVRLSELELLDRRKKWTEFLEEINLRGLPLDEWGPLVVRDIRGTHEAKDGDPGEK